MVMAETRSQGTNCEISSERGLLPRILRSIIALRVTSSTMELHIGLLGASASGRRMDLFCGFVAIRDYERVFFGMWFHDCLVDDKYIFKLFLSSAITEDIKNMRESGSALVYHYFDFKEVAKRHIRGLLTWVWSFATLNRTRSIVPQSRQERGQSPRAHSLYCPPRPSRPEQWSHTGCVSMSLSS
ncbi:hypothetical protein BC827DRAFT_47691 [Russula dissimulans]|nr:hypothetical protein BC827DRAFT_47691 [Russula dissimulans]